MLPQVADLRINSPALDKHAVAQAASPDFPCSRKAWGKCVLQLLLGIDVG